MADRAESIVAFEEIAARLRDAVVAGVRALTVHAGTAMAGDLDRALEHALDRLALLYGGVALDSQAIEAVIDAAIGAELRLAHDLDATEAAAARARAQALVDVARRGDRLHVHGPVPEPLLRGVHIAHPRPEVERALRIDRVPYVAWRGGILVVISDHAIARLRAAGDEVDVLFLDPDELLDLDGRGDRAARDAEVERRIDVARGAPDRIGDDRTRYALRTLLIQSKRLRYLRDRLAAPHPAAHRALLPLLAAHRASLERVSLAMPVAPSVAAAPFAALIDQERALQVLVARWAAEPDDGLGDRFRAVAGAGSPLAELERHLS